MSDTPITAEAVARAFRAAADALQSEPAGPRPAAVGFQGPDGDTVRRLLADLTAADRRALQSEVAQGAAEREADRLREEVTAEERRAVEAEGAVVGLQAANATLRREMASMRADYRAQEGPASPLSATQSAQNAPEVLVDPPGPQNGAEAVLAVVEAARAWRNNLACDVRGGPGVLDSAADLIDAVDALGDNGSWTPPGRDWMHAAHELGWRAGVRWAAAEADAQARGHYNLSGDMIDITNHLRLCADDPRRNTAVPRDQEPEARP